MQDPDLKKPENTQIPEDNSDDFDILVDIPVAPEQKETKNDVLKENQEVPKKTLPTANEQIINDNILLSNDVQDNISAENNKKKIESNIKEKKEKAEPEIIENPQEKINDNAISPRVIIKEKIIERELSDEEIKKLYKKILLEHLKNAREKRRAAYENNLKLIEQKGNNEKFTPKSVAKNLKVSKRTASRYLRKLFKQGKVMRFGTGKKLFYQVYAR